MGIFKELLWLTLETKDRTLEEQYNHFSEKQRTPWRSHTAFVAHRSAPVSFLKIVLFLDFFSPAHLRFSLFPFAQVRQMGCAVKFNYIRGNLEFTVLKRPLCSTRQWVYKTTWCGCASYGARLPLSLSAHLCLESRTPALW